MNLDYKDPFGLLPWLYDVLFDAEKNGEKVHIISHAPPGDHTAISGWGQNWAKIVDRFANTISAQFYGHTHNDQFIVWYDLETNSVPINVGYVCPSVTTYTGLNPSYRIYTLDGPYEGASMVNEHILPENYKTQNYVISSRKSWMSRLTFSI